MCISLTRSMVVPSFLLLLVMVLESHAESYTVGSIDRKIYWGVRQNSRREHIFRDFARFFVSSDWPQCILRKDDRALVKFPSE